MLVNHAQRGMAPLDHVLSKCIKKLLLYLQECQIISDMIVVKLMFIVLGGNFS